ncbi:MAG: GNAT family N-acetyltransferase [Phycisphaerales bacterium]
MRTPGSLIRALHAETPHRAGVTVVPGSRADYDALAPLHYRAGPPATLARILIARDDDRGELAGVLVVSRPTLNGAWRRHAWPGRYDTGDKRARARRINAELRTISRVIVDPRYRGRGVGVRLVAAYLDRPDTPRTEAIAAMGAVCPFFERAGMRLVRTGPAERDLDLLRALARVGWPSDPGACAMRLVRRGAPDAERALRAWARRSASTRSLTEPAELACAAAGALLGPAAAYAHDRTRT